MYICYLFVFCSDPTTITWLILLHAGLYMYVQDQKVKILLTVKKHRHTQEVFTQVGSEVF